MTAAPIPGLGAGGLDFTSNPVAGPSQASSGISGDFIIGGEPLFGGGVQGAIATGLPWLIAGGVLLWAFTRGR